MEITPTSAKVHILSVLTDENFTSSLYFNCPGSERNRNISRLLAAGLYNPQPPFHFFFLPQEQKFKFGPLEGSENRPKNRLVELALTVRFSGIAAPCAVTPDTSPPLCPATGHVIGPQTRAVRTLQSALYRAHFKLKKGLRVSPANTFKWGNNSPANTISSQERKVQF